MLYTALKALHVACAVLSISGFTLRGILMLADSPLLATRDPIGLLAPALP